MTERRRRMVHRIGLAACALSLLIATAAWAQAGAISGIVTHVDPATRIVYFADGRWIRLEPATKLTVDGREATIEALRPGMTLVVWERTAAPVQTSPPVSMPPPHSPIDASGVVVKVDEQTKVITFQDGRMVQVTDRTRIWQQPASVGALRPGTQVFVHNAQPIAYQIAPGSAAGGRYLMGTVVRVDPASSVAVLSDGTLVRIAPATTLRMDNQPLTLQQLQPGDQVVVWQRNHVGPVVVTPGAGQIPAGQSADSPSALPRQDLYVTIDAHEIVVVRRPQAP
jgi:Domain of unknown function (DUF5666)